MTLINAKLEFLGSGQIRASVDTILFDDTYLTQPLPLAEAGHSGLDVRFVNKSIVGALNELIDGLTETSGNASPVNCYTEAVDSVQFVHDINHNLNTRALMLQMYDGNPNNGSGVATNVLTCWKPLNDNTVRVELDAAASGYFVIFGCLA